VRARWRGRHWLALWLSAFLVAALIVVWRQSAARATALELRELERRRGALEVRKAALVGALHRARSRAVLVPLAERRLGLRLPDDSEITIVQEPVPR
jgi:hypothetical protein